MKKEDSLLKTTIESSFIVPYNENDQEKEIDGIEVYHAANSI